MSNEQRKREWDFCPLSMSNDSSKTVAKKEFPNETWVGIDNLELNHVSIPKDATGILVARSRLPINK